MTAVNVSFSGAVGAWSLYAISDIGSQLSNTALILSLLTFPALSYLSLFFSMYFSMVRTGLTEILTPSFDAPWGSQSL
jgi:hypothetical protein